MINRQQIQIKFIKSKSELTDSFIYPFYSMNNLQYLTPRIALVTEKCFAGNLQKTSQLILNNHQHYVHIFNFTKTQISQMPQSQYKWRGVPYSISETFKVLADLDAFLRINIANTAIFFVEQGNLQQYGKFIVLAYMRICEISSKSIISSWPNKIVLQQPYTLHQIQQIYQSSNIQSPPLKIIQKLYIQPLDGGQQPFIPVFKIFSETRYNQFENVYNHAITEQLTEYYLNRNKCLKTSIGTKYDDCKPETDFMLKPVIVSGDVRIQILSFKQLKLKQQCIIGFSTRCLKLQKCGDINGQTCQQLILSPEDLYNDISKGAYPYTIHIQISNYCDIAKCEDHAVCTDCKQHNKKIASRYLDTQQSLEKVKRQRKLTEVRKSLSI